MPLAVEVSGKWAAHPARPRGPLAEPGCGALPGALHRRRLGRELAAHRPLCLAPLKDTLEGLSTPAKGSRTEKCWMAEAEAGISANGLIVDMPSTAFFSEMGDTGL